LLSRINGLQFRRVESSVTTKIYNLSQPADRDQAIREAAGCLQEGGLVVFPTETVYGLGANAAHSEALKRLREVKQRSASKPFTIHIGSRSDVRRFVPELNGVGKRLVEKAWPGPLTLIFDVANVADAPIIRETSAEHIPSMYNKGTIGLRCPDDPVAAALLTNVTAPVVAASANPAGQEPPTDAEDAMNSLDGQVDIILDAGRTRYSMPSTIVHVTQNGYKHIRDGVLDERTIHRLARLNFLLICSGNTCRSPMAAGILRKLLTRRLDCRIDELEERGIHVESAGTSALAGLPPSATAVEVMRERGIDITGHASRPVTLELLHRADYIFTMTASHRDVILLDDPTIIDRVRTLDTRDIADPIGGDRATYAACADQIEQAMIARLEEITL
jgi:protein-tyrosine phosphatase